MPGGPATNQRVTRTDLGNLDFFYDGTRWLTVQLFKTQLATPRLDVAVNPVTATTGSAFRGSFPDKWGGTNIWAERVMTGFLVEGGTALSGSHKWVGTVVTSGASATHRHHHDRQRGVGCVALDGSRCRCAGRG